ncbi:MAG: carboxypeptidase regulatory-like domain-containing protein, partial [Acidobacteria bacterium]|nr:carboxypeptidase regulatory-like domain-containing protein [Acidobacteriota bacterium]
MKPNNVHRTLVTAAIWFSFSLICFAQTAQLTGRITDSSEAVVPSVDVVVTNISTGLARTTKSNAVGYYTMPLLPRGSYRVAVRSTGFKPIERSGITLDEGQALRLDFVMEVGAVTENIEISGTPTLIETTTNAVSTVIPNQRLLDMPMRGRNFFSLVDLVPGVRGLGDYSDIPVAAWGSAQAAIGGGTPGGNNLMVDGIAAEGVASGAFNVFLSLDAIEEFRIITRNASAEYGRTGGGVINVVSKSGTNDYHGSVYEFLRNRVFNANGFFSNRVGRDDRPAQQFNQYGAAVGGRVIRDKTFFYFNFEQVRRRSQSRVFRTVPTLLQREGDFSRTFNPSGQMIRIYDPYTSRMDPQRPGNRIRDPFPGNVIPSNRINPVSRAVLDYYPLPNLPGSPVTEANNFFGQGAAPLDKNAWGIKIDHNFTANRRLSGRFTYDMTSTRAANFYGNIAEPGNAGSDFPRRSFALNYTEAIRPDLLLEARAGVNRFFNSRVPRAYGFDIAKIGLPATLNSQIQYPLFPRFTPAGVAEIGPNQSDFIRQSNDAWSGAAAITKIRGSHVMKFGVEQRIYMYNNTQNGPVMNFDFAATFTRGPDPNVASARDGNGLATFLLGTPTGGQSRRWIPITSRATNFGAFIQDDWKVSPKLTLNLGLRWEFEGAITDRYNALSNFDPRVETKVNDLTLRGALVYPGTSGLSRGLRDNSFNDFGPRFGFAYQLA